MEQTTAAAGTSVATDRWPLGRYVVGMDGSVHSQYALARALKLVEITRSQVEAVSAWSYPPFHGPAFVPTAWSLEDGAKAILAGSVQS
jgi:hypothetical protein